VAGLTASPRVPRWTGIRIGVCAFFNLEDGDSTFIRNAGLYGDIFEETSISSLAAIAKWVSVGLWGSIPGWHKRFLVFGAHPMGTRGFLLRDKMAGA
jgi:hypothetical protein